MSDKTCIIIDKNGNESNAQVDIDLSNVYKKCGFKKPDNFACQHIWKHIEVNEDIYMNIEVYGRTTDKTNTINKCELPPPLEHTFFYGSRAIVLRNEDNVVLDMDTTLWNYVYEHLFDGFEDLDNEELCKEDDNESDELDAYPDAMKTKSGYLKDDFVVDSTDDDGEYDGEDEEDDGELEEEEYILSDEEDL